ncbi:WD40 repeat domain-containing protein [Micromonospora sp. MH33]|uniref:WD40 repeat domain-containing protein n=1 Tax=Micromonospora sp. MH33 TaxID=1945509 RepID=UPI0011B212B6|nr:WD40 repeat domain-containing protein [Micromonospora sp. MH33]
MTGRLKRLNDELHILHARAGWPSVRDMARACDCGPNIIKNVFSVARTPSLPRLLGIVAFLAKLDRKADPDELCDRFDALWQAAMADQVPDLFPPKITDSDDEDGFEPPAAGARPDPPGPVGPRGGGVSTPPTASEPTAPSPTGGVARESGPESHGDEWRALFVGVDTYLTAGAAPVVHRDLRPARQLAGIFRESADDGQSPDTNELLLNPTRERLWSSFVEAASQARETLIIYYIGHGIRDARTSEVYLSAADTVTTADGFTINAISVRDIRYLLALSPVKQLVLIVDAHFDNRPERQTTVLPVRPVPDEPYHVASDSLRRRVFVMSHSAEEDTDLSAFSSGLVQVFHATGSGKSMAAVHAQMAALAEAQNWRGPRRAYLNDGDQIPLDGLLRDRESNLISVWRVNNRFQLTRTATPPFAIPGDALVAVNRNGHGLSVARAGAHLSVQLRSMRHDGTKPDIQPVTERPHHRVESLALAAVTGGRTVLLASSSYGLLEYWTWAQGSEIAATTAAHMWSVNAVAAVVPPDGNAVLCAISDSKTIISWTTQEGTNSPSLLQVDDDVSAAALAFTSDERVLVIAGHSTGRVIARDLESGQVLADLNTWHAGGVTAIAAGSTLDGHIIVATADESGTVQVWDLANQTEIGQPIRGVSNRVVLAAVSDAEGVRFVIENE